MASPPRVSTSSRPAPARRSTRTSAFAGDAECSYYSVGNGNPATFIAALAEIQKAVMGCSFVIPSNGSGLVDLDSADVVFTESSSSNPENLGAVANLAACNSSSQ